MGQEDQKMKTPSHSNPRYVCARIRKILAAQGWPLSKTSGVYSPFGGSKTVTTEGYYAYKVGVSKRVTVNYTFGSRSFCDREVRRAKLYEAVELLRGLGYRITEDGRIECDYYDNHDY